jgi:hypothetical protein
VTWRWLKLAPGARHVVDKMPYNYHFVADCRGIGAASPFMKTQRSVRSASAAHVRRPNYGSSVGRWHAYEEFIAPLLAALRPR